MLTQKRLKELLSYNLDTGEFTWREDKGNKVRIGDIAGCLTEANYINIKAGYKVYAAHRLAFLYVAGYLPEHQVDHINGTRDDNRWCNLRHVSQTCNLQNQKTSKNNVSGFPGVSECPRKFKAQLKFKGNILHLGYYTDPLEAALARFTCEVWHEGWNCNARSELAQAIKRSWPEFKGGLNAAANM